MFRAALLGHIRYSLEMDWRACIEYGHQFLFWTPRILNFEQHCLSRPKIFPAFNYTMSSSRVLSRQQGFRGRSPVVRDLSSEFASMSVSRSPSRTPSRTPSSSSLSSVRYGPAKVTRDTHWEDPITLEDVPHSMGYYIAPNAANGKVHQAYALGSLQSLLSRSGGVAKSPITRRPFRAGDIMRIQAAAGRELSRRLSTGSSRRRSMSRSRSM